MQSYREVLQKKFTAEYTSLNNEQRKAVDTIEGPVMVIAGPGTGKTQILAARIGKILLETDSLPENILCLTYTDAGTIAMRKRLQQFIGADAYRVNIYTFHSFCNDVIQDNLQLFEKTFLDAISELESIQLFKILIDSLPKNHPLKRYKGDVYYEVNNLRSLFSTMKREGWKPDYISEKIDEYINDLPLRDEFIYLNKYKEYKAGDLKQNKINAEKDKMEKLRAAVNEFQNYQALMYKKNRYDFDDMINWVINMFEENKNILANYQEKFQYLLVDEYQDTSGIQNKLVYLLINYWDKPNVFVVGDDDQSIYRFQGANLENMIEFANRYSEDLITVVLTSNYRSTQPILDISKTLINKNNERLVKKIKGLSKELVCYSKELIGLKNNPVIHEYNSIKDEMADITNRVTELIKQNIAPGRIAIIYKENKYGEELATYFGLKKIPFYSKRSINVLTQPFASKIIQLMRYLNTEHDIPYGGDEMFFEILHFDFYKIPTIEIAKLTVETKTLKYKGEQTSIRKLLSDKANKQGNNLFEPGIHQKLKDFSFMIEELIADVVNITLQELFERIIKQAGVLSYIMQSSNKISLLQLLTALFDFIKDETSRNPTLQLKELISILDLMEKENIALPINKVAGNDKGVNLLTTHGSKGLEFEYIFFAGANASIWENKRKPGGGYKFPDTIFASQPASADSEELRRLFYVALTRAEQHLYISYAKLKNDGKNLEPSKFIIEIIEEHDLPIEKIELTEEAQIEFALLNFTAQAPEIEQAEEDFISGILEKFVMNVTALNNYLSCPLNFYYRNLIRIPSGKSEAAEFGSAIHYALENLFQKMRDRKKEIFPSSEEMFADFKCYIKKHRENFTKEAFNRRIEYGEEVLRNYYDKYVNVWNKSVIVETNIRGIVINGVPIKGQLDKMEFNGKDVNVVDYKSGDIENALLKIKPPNDKNLNGGDYWRQAVFYKILIDHYDQEDWKVISAEFDFVEPNKIGEYRKEKIVINPQDIVKVKKQITEVWNKIQARDFYIGCGKEKCHWCNFVKNNNLAVALHDIVEDGEEDGRIE